MKKILFLLLALMLSAFSAAAQPTANGTDLKLPDISYAALNKELDKTVAALNDGKTSVEQSGAILDRLEEIQGQINQTLPAFLTAQDNLQKKIAALGDVPADGKEPAAIAAQRRSFASLADTYKTQIAQANLAKTKIDDINGLILKLRNRSLFNNIFAKQSSIFHPQEFWESLVSFAKFSYNLLRSPLDWYRQLPNNTRKAADDNITFAVFYLVVAFIAAVYARRYIKTWFGYRASIPHPDYSQKVRAALWMLLARGLIPAAIIGTFMFWLHNNEIINKTSFGSLLNTAALYLLYFFLSQALVKIAFTPFNSKWRIIEVNDARAQSISSALIFSAAAVCIVSFFQSLSGQMNNTETIYALKIFANAVKAFCVILVANKFLYDNDLQNKNADAALEEIPASAQNNADEDPGELSVGAKISLAITFFMSIAFAASLFGYIRLSEFAINRFIVSALIIALFYILYKLFRVFFRKLLSFRFWVKTFRINPRTLVKANFWFALILKPVLSLIALFFLLAAWGVSVDILLNKIKNFLIGFNIGSVHISITSILLGLLTFFVSLFLFRSLKNSFINGSLSQIDMEDGVKSSLISAIGFFGFIFSLIFGIAVMGGSFSSIAIMAGALSFGAGLGLQNIVSNLVAGMTILFERPIKIGDWVIINGQEGIVKRINMRATELETWNKANVIIPNSDILSKSVVNKTYANRMGRVEIKIGVDYDSDLNLVKKLLLEIANNDAEVLKDPAPSLLFTDFGDNSLNFQLNCYTSNVYNSSGIANRIREKIVEQFRSNQINIPFQQRVVHLIETSVQ